MADLGEINVSFTADTSGFKSAMKGVLGTVTAVTGAMGLAVAAAVNLTTSMADTADNAAKAAKRVGTTAEAMQELGYAADLSGASMDDVEKAMGRLGANAVDASNGIGEAKDAFERLGISVTTSNGELKSQDQLLEESAQAISQLSTETEKVALAQDIFGRAGRKLLPMLNEGSAGIAEMRKEARDLGLVLDNETAAAAEEFNDNLRRLEGATDGLKNELGTALLPVLDSVVKEFTAMTRELKGTDKAATAAKTTVGGLSDLIKAMAPALTVVGALTGALVDGFKLLDISASTLAIMVGTATEGILMMKDAMEGSEESGQELAAFQQRLGGLVEETRQKIDSFGEATKTGAAFGDELANATNRIADAMKNGTKETKEFLAEYQKLLGSGAQGPVNPHAPTGGGGGGGGGSTARRPSGPQHSTLDDYGFLGGFVPPNQVGAANGSTVRATPQDSNSTPGALAEVAESGELANEALTGLSGALTVATGGMAAVGPLLADMAMQSEAVKSGLGSLKERLSEGLAPAFEGFGFALETLSTLMKPLVPVLKAIAFLSNPFAQLKKAVEILLNIFPKLKDALKNFGESLKKASRSLTRKAMKSAGFSEKQIDATLGSDETETRRHHEDGSGPGGSIETNGTIFQTTVDGILTTGEALGELAEAAKKATDEMLNVPTIFARNLRRGQAGNLSGRSLSQLGESDRAASSTAWNVDTMNVYADNPEEMQRAAQRRQYVRRGSGVQDAANFVYGAI